AGAAAQVGVGLFTLLFIVIDRFTEKEMAMKRWVLLLAALVLGACSQAPAGVPESETQSNNGQAAAVTSERCGDPSRLSDSVSFYNWTDYIDPEILTMFEEECGVRVVYDTFSSNEDLLAKLQAGATG